MNTQVMKCVARIVVGILIGLTCFYTLPRGNDPGRPLWPYLLWTGYLIIALIVSVVRNRRCKKRSVQR